MEKKPGLLLVLADEFNMFRDIENDPRVVIYNVGLRHKFFRYIKKLVYTLSYYGVSVPMPKWIFTNPLRNVPDSIHHVAILANLIEFIPFECIQKLRESGKGLSALLIDSMHADSMTIKKTRVFLDLRYWDEIITFDSRDAVEFGWTYIGPVFYSYNVNPSGGCGNNSVYFVGSPKGGRTETINALYSFLKNNGIPCEFDILISSEKDKDAFVEGINTFRKSIPYAEVLRKVQRCSCILEILQDNQAGPSLRFSEAVFNNKKLLTNNTHIENLPCFKPEYMKIFKSLQDIDTDWLTADIDVDYNYQGELSPSHLIDYLVSRK